MPQLEELYVPFNNITTLEPLSLGHDSLAVLDVEGNCVATLTDLDYLYVSAVSFMSI